MDLRHRGRACRGLRPRPRAGLSQPRSRRDLLRRGTHGSHEPRYPAGHSPGLLLGAAVPRRGGRLPRRRRLLPLRTLDARASVGYRLAIGVLRLGGLAHRSADCRRRVGHRRRPSVCRATDLPDVHAALVPCRGRGDHPGDGDNGDRHPPDGSPSGPERDMGMGAPRAGRGAHLVGRPDGHDAPRGRRAGPPGLAAGRTPRTRPLSGSRHVRRRKPAILVVEPPPRVGDVPPPHELGRPPARFRGPVSLCGEHPRAVSARHLLGRPRRAAVAVGKPARLDRDRRRVRPGRRARAWAARPLGPARRPAGAAVAGPAGRGRPGVLAHGRRAATDLVRHVGRRPVRADLLRPPPATGHRDAGADGPHGQTGSLRGDLAGGRPARLQPPHARRVSSVPARRRRSGQSTP